MPVDRLTAEDLLMLWPDEIWPQDIGALAILDGSLLGSGGRFRIEAVRDVVAARLHLVPRFRQLLCVPRRGLGGPLWGRAGRLGRGPCVESPGWALLTSQWHGRGVRDRSAGAAWDGRVDASAGSPDVRM
jgi:hypothetical protein